MKYKDIYTEAPANPDTLSMLGPIAPLAGKWFGDDGVDTHPQAGGPETEPYVETWDFELMDPQNNGPQGAITCTSPSRASSPPSMTRWAICSTSPRRTRST